MFRQPFLREKSLWFLSMPGKHGRYVETVRCQRLDGSAATHAWSGSDAMSSDLGDGCEPGSHAVPAPPFSRRQSGSWRWVRSFWPLASSTMRHRWFSPRSCSMVWLWPRWRCSTGAAATSRHWWAVTRSRLNGEGQSGCSAPGAFFHCHRCGLRPAPRRWSHAIAMRAQRRQGPADPYMPSSGPSGFRTSETAPSRSPAVRLALGCRTARLPHWW